MFHPDDDDLAIVYRSVIFKRQGGDDDWGYFTELKLVFQPWEPKPKLRT